jgi:Ca-activated chloride channel family protein
VIRGLAFAAVWLATVGAGWLDPNAAARRAARLYDAGKFDDAATAYDQALVDDPDSPLLHFNLADARYRDGKFDEAVAALAAVPASDADPGRTARVFYNAGNATYRLGAAAAASDPQKALGLWAQALVAYRRAMGADPTDGDAKFNHELVERKIAELQKKLEDEKKKQQDQKQQQEQQSDQQQQQQQQQPQSGQDGAQQQQEQPKDEQSDQQQAGGQQQEQQPAGGEQTPGETASAGHDGTMSEREATAILDSARDQEVRPGDVVRRMQGGRVAEPSEDW